MTFGVKILKTEDLLTATGPVFNVFSYSGFTAKREHGRSLTNDG